MPVKLIHTEPAEWPAHLPRIGEPITPQQRAPKPQREAKRRGRPPKPKPEKVVAIRSAKPPKERKPRGRPRGVSDKQPRQAFRYLEPWRRRRSLYLRATGRLRDYHREF